MKGKSRLGLLATLALAAVSPTAGYASPVAMAANMVGKPEYRAAGGTWKPLGVLTRLSPGDTVRCGAGQEAIVMMFLNGVRFKVASNHTATVNATAIKGADMMGGMGGANVRVAKNMTGLDTQPFLARPAQSHERLDKSTPGTIPAGTRHFTWRPLEAAVSYSFTIFDQHDNVIWSARSADTSADLPDDLPDLATHRPYVWTLSGFGRSGKPVPVSIWGMITFLSKADSDQLVSDTADLTSQLAAKPSDITPLLLQVELYRQYGVYEGLISTLEDTRLSGQPGIAEQLDKSYMDVSPFAAFLRQGNMAPHGDDHAGL